MKKHISSGAVVYIFENGIKKFLIMHRKKTNSWHLPKGTREKGETIEVTTLREIKEETGLNIKLGKYIDKLNSTFIRDDRKVQKETHYFLGQPKIKKIILDGHDSEHNAVYFFDYKTALKYLESFSLFEKEGAILKMANKMIR